MPILHGDRIVEVTTTTGTGTLTLSGAVATYRTCAQSVAAGGSGNLTDGCTTEYLVAEVDANGVFTGTWESTQGVYTVATNTLTRGTFLASSTGSRINLAAGTKHVYIGVSAKTMDELITGPSSAVDNAVLRADGTTGKLAQGTNVIIDDSNNVGVDVTPDTWTPAGGGKSIQGFGFLLGGGFEDELYLANNAYRVGATYKRREFAAACLYRQRGNTHTWYGASSDAADTDITWTTVMNIPTGGAVSFAQGLTTGGALTVTGLSALNGGLQVTGTMDISDYISSTVADGFAPFFITSTTRVANLNVDRAGVADGLKSATTTVDVSAATAPTSGQVLTATSDTTATWQTPSTGGDMVLASVQSVTGLKTFDKDKLAMKGTSTGVTTFSTANTGASNYTATFQAASGTVAYTSDIPSVITKISGNSGAAGSNITWQSLTANSVDVTTTTVSSSVMTTTGVGAGTWKAKYTVFYQTAATTTGIGFAINHTGTVSKYRGFWYHPTTGGAATTGTGDSDTATVAGQMIEGKHGSTLNAIIGSTTGGVDTINTDITAIIEATLIVTVSGSLELKLASEVDTSAVRITSGSILELLKIG